jgi:hypothetical protein
MNCLRVVPMWFVLEEKGHFRYNITSMKVKKIVCY